MVLLQILDWYVLYFGDRVIEHEDTGFVEDDVLFDDDDYGR